MSARATKLIALLLGAIFIFSVAMIPSFAQSGRKAINKPNPTYPDLARKMNIKGRVTLRVVIGSDGRAKQVTPQGGHPLLVQACTDVLPKWLWERGAEQTTVLEFNFE